jgi:hypothetical protein
MANVCMPVYLCVCTLTGTHTHTHKYTSPQAKLVVNRQPSWPCSSTSQAQNKDAKYVPVIGSESRTRRLLECLMKHLSVHPMSSKLHLISHQSVPIMQYEIGFASLRKRCGDLHSWARQKQAEGCFFLGTRQARLVVL